MGYFHDIAAPSLLVYCWIGCQQEQLLPWDQPNLRKCLYMYYTSWREDIKCCVDREGKIKLLWPFLCSLDYSWINNRFEEVFSLKNLYAIFPSLLFIVIWSVGEQLSEDLVPEIEIWWPTTRKRRTRVRNWKTTECRSIEENKKVRYFSRNRL